MTIADRIFDQAGDGSWQKMTWQCREQASERMIRKDGGAVVVQYTFPDGSTLNKPFCGKRPNS